ncbi:MAG: heat-inducible transcription repressor HrcA [PVC group bacterium]|nr:heat-inducible transcription repressor HrcA [PVC group bacterium]
MTVDIQSRRDKILRVIINTYINSGNPVSSRSVCSHSRLGLCSASIRNVMADLEDMGMITHMHTSAGRVPTDKGYRFYVDELLDNAGLTSNEQQNISKGLIDRQLILEEIISKTSKVLSDFTKYAGVVSHPVIKRSYFKRIQFTPLGEGKICVTLIANTGVAKNSVVSLGFKIQKDSLKRIENFMNSQLENVPLSQIKSKLRRMMIEERNSFFYILKQAAELIDLSLLVNEDTRVYFEGLSNILDFPEFGESEVMRSLIKVLDQKKTLADLVQDIVDEEVSSKRVRVYIGKENPHSFMGDCTIILTRYKIDDETVGGLGIIGPKRMNYGKTIATVEYVSDILSEMLTELSI